MAKKDFSKLLWIPQFLAAAYTVFLVYFWEKASLGTESFVTELLPSFVILAIVAVTWKKPKFCGIFFLMFAAAFAVYAVFTDLSFDNAYLLMAIMACMPAIIGILFFIFAKKAPAKADPEVKAAQPAEKPAEEPAE